MSMLGEITHLQTLTDDLKALTMDPHKLPPSSEQVQRFSRSDLMLFRVKKVREKKKHVLHFHIFQFICYQNFLLWLLVTQLHYS